MFEQLVHRTKRTISSDQRIVDPRNVATQHNVASSRGRVVCRNESGKKRKRKSEKEEKKISMALDKLRGNKVAKSGAKLLLGTPPCCFPSIQMELEELNVSRHFDLSISLFFPPPPKMAKNRCRVILILRREGNYATRILFFNLCGE